jgi:hypothetical protein
MAVKGSLEWCHHISEGKKGKPNGHLGMHRSPEARQKIRVALKGRPHPWCSGGNNPMKRPEVRAKFMGERNRRWNGGSSFEPYCPKFTKEFKERVRAFWVYKCGNCGKPQEKNGRKLHVHHVNYRKDTCCNEEVARQFIPLCNSCHSGSNNNREEWEQKFSQLIEEKYGGRCYFRQGEQLVAYGVKT